MTSPTIGTSAEGTLRRCELLDPLSDAQIKALAERAERRTVADGESLFRQNEESRHLFVVQSGELSIRLTLPTGEQAGWFVAGRYSLLGWSAFIEPPLYAADAHALGGEAEVLVIGVDEAEQVMLREPQSAYQVMKRIAGHISTRLRDLREQFAEVAGAR